MLSSRVVQRISGFGSIKGEREDHIARQEISKLNFRNAALAGIIENCNELARNCMTRDFRRIWSKWLIRSPKEEEVVVVVFFYCQSNANT